MKSVDTAIHAVGNVTNNVNFHILKNNYIVLCAPVETDNTQGIYRYDNFGGMENLLLLSRLILASNSDHGNDVDLFLLFVSRCGPESSGNKGGSEERTSCRHVSVCG